jgi:hypothetical protein
MKQFFSNSSGSPAGFNHGRAVGRAWPAVIVLAMAAAGCSDETTPLPGSTAGSGGQLTAGSGGAGVAGSSGAATGGTLPGTSGSAGMVGTSGGGGTAGSSGGTGGSSGGTGGSGGGAGGAGGTAGAGGSGGSEAGWVSLFNGMNLEGWTPSAGHQALFAVTQLENEGVIHVYPTQEDQTTQPQAALRTTKSFGSYVFQLEYKWGTKRYSDRKQTARDNGICFHICNDPAKVWPDSIEFQLGAQAWPGDWVSGNIFMLVDKTRAQWSYTSMNGQEVFSPTGTKKSIGAPMSYYRALVAPPNQNKDEGWNTIELTVHGSTDAEYKVNGMVVNGLTDMECNEGGTWKPLDHGPIALQAEFAEVYFRKIRIKELP